MGFLLMFAAFVMLGLCLAKDREQRCTFLGGVLALLCLPIGILLALIKNHK